MRDQVILDDHNRPIVLPEEIDDKKGHNISSKTQNEVSTKPVDQAWGRTRRAFTLVNPEY